MFQIVWSFIVSSQLEPVDETVHSMLTSLCKGYYRKKIYTNFWGNFYLIMEIIRAWIGQVYQKGVSFKLVLPIAENLPCRNSGTK